MFKINGCAVLCDDGGNIKKIFRDDFGLWDKKNINGLFYTVFEPNSRQKALHMLIDAKKHSIAMDYKLNVKYEDAVKSLYFFCTIISDNLLIVGTENNKDTIEFTNQLQQINNEQTNHIRSILKENTTLTNQQQSETQDLFEELTKVNNELVNLQRELSKKNIELERLNEIKNHFLGMAAHDLRNPLGIVLNYIDFLKSESNNLTDLQIEFMDHIYSLNNFMLNMVNDLLDVSNIESGKIHLNLQPIDINQLIASNVKINSSIAAQKDIKINFGATCDSAILNIDEMKIEQVLNNLITNAIKFSKKGTNIFISCIKSNEGIVLEIRDEGQGILEKELPLLFKPFQKTSTATTGGEESTGLGLYIVKRIVEAHNGKIKVQSKHGQGTTFIIRLPIASNQ